MKRIPVFAAVALAGLLSTSPAFALFCTNSGPGLGFEFTLGSKGLKPNPNAQEDFDLMRLRRAGVDATMVERWNGCLRAFVRTGNGIRMQFYDPATLNRLQ